MRDITSRKLAEKEIKQERAKLLAMISSMDEGVVFANDNNIIVEVNDYLCKFVQRDRKEILGKKIEDIHSGPILRRVLDYISSFRNDPDSNPIVIQRAIGKAEVMMRFQPIYRERQYDGVLMNVINVSDLVEARREAESANRVKGEFLANMSHEIRTPMNAIFGMTHLALETEVTPEQKEYLTAVKTASENLLTIINDILDFLKIEAGHLELDEIDFDLRSTLETAADTLAVNAHEKGLELTCDVSSEVHEYLIGDPGRLRQIILNLGGNAIKFTEGGEINISCGLEKLDEESTLLHFEVSDTGKGIPPQGLESIFESFNQVDGSTTREYGGTGLGLSISKQLVELMGGKIGAESELGVGSTFPFTAPFQVQRNVDISPTDASPIDLKGKRALIVDDNATNRKVLKHMLSAWDVSSEETPDGESALNAMERAIEKSKPFDLVFMDVQMPVLDGLAATKEIRNSELKIKDIPIIAMTAHAMMGDREKCLDVGMDDYISKPIDPQDLSRVLNKWASKPEKATKEPTEAKVQEEYLNREIESHPPVNYDKALQRALGDREFLQQMLHHFRERLGKDLEILKQELDKGAFSNLEKNSLCLKGAAVNLSAEGVAAAAYQLEQAGREGDLASAKRNLEKLCSETQRLNVFLEKTD